jgi:hypothetical protein
LRHAPIPTRRRLLCKSLALAGSAISSLFANPTFNVNGTAEGALESLRWAGLPLSFDSDKDMSVFLALQPDLALSD